MCIRLYKEEEMKFKNLQLEFQVENYRSVLEGMETVVKIFDQKVVDDHREHKDDDDSIVVCLN